MFSFLKPKPKLISSKLIKKRSDKIAKKASRLARRRVRRGEIVDVHTFSMYLKTVDAEYDELKTYITNSTTVRDYATLRSTTLAQTRSLVEFYDSKHKDLVNAYATVQEKAKAAGKGKRYQSDVSEPPNITPLKESLSELSGEKREPKVALRRPKPAPTSAARSNPATKKPTPNIGAKNVIQ